MTLLWELGLAARVPERAAREMTAALNAHYLRFFPSLGATYYLI